MGDHRSYDISHQFARLIELGLGKFLPITERPKFGGLKRFLRVSVNGTYRYFTKSQWAFLLSPVHLIIGFLDPHDTLYWVLVDGSGEDLGQRTHRSLMWLGRMTSCICKLTLHGLIHCVYRHIYYVLLVAY